MNSNEAADLETEGRQLAGQPLADFLQQLEDYTPTVSHLIQI